MIGSVVIKLIVGLIGILVFLRVTGKTQMAKMTPLDTVNGVLMGTIIGSIIYQPAISVWALVLGIAVWTVLNVGLRFFLRKSKFRRLINGRYDLLIEDGILDIKKLRRNNLDMEQLRAKLREMDIYSLMDVEKVRFETDGEFTVYKKKKSGAESHLLVNNGELMEDTMKEIRLTKKWLNDELRKMGLSDYKDIFCVEWTPTRGFYVVTMKGRIITKILSVDPRKKPVNKRARRKAEHKGATAKEIINTK